MLNERLDQLFISLQLPPADLGLYVVAATAARGLGGIGDTLGTLIFPKIAYAETPELRARLAGRYIRAALILSLPPVVIMIALSEWLIALVFGRSFVSAAPVMQVLLLMIIPLNAKCVMAAALKGLNHALSVGMVQAAALMISLAALAILLPTLGLMGAAIASLVTQLAAAVMMAAEVRRRLGVGFKDQLWPCAEDVTFVLGFLRFREKGPAHE
jgi:O-antigen/teichoic acid export membrane protein